MSLGYIWIYFSVSSLFWCLVQLIRWACFHVLFSISSKRHDCGDFIILPKYYPTPKPAYLRHIAYRLIHSTQPSGTWYTVFYLYSMCILIIINILVVLH